MHSVDKKGREIKQKRKISQEIISNNSGSFDEAGNFNNTTNGNNIVFNDLE